MGKKKTENERVGEMVVLIATLWKEKKWYFGEGGKEGVGSELRRRKGTKTGWDQRGERWDFLRIKRQCRGTRKEPSS